MPKFLSNDDFNTLKEAYKFTLEDLAYKSGFSEKTIQSIASGTTKHLTQIKQKDLLDTLTELAKKRIESNSDSDKFIKMTPLNLIRIDKTFEELRFEEIKTWIQEGPIEDVAMYGYNFDSTYKWIDENASIFLLRCTSINDDLKRELVDFMQAFSVKLSGIEQKLPTVKQLLNAAETIKKRNADYKKSNIEKSNQEPAEVEAYRNNLEEKFCKLFFNSDDSKSRLGNIIYVQRGRCYEENNCTHWQPSFVTQMDDISWKLLILYVMIQSDDELGDKSDKISHVNEKLTKLIKQNEKEHA